MPPSVHPMLPFHLAHATGALIGLLQCLFKHYAGLEYSRITDARYMIEFGAAGRCVCVCGRFSNFPSTPGIKNFISSHMHNERPEFW